MNLLNQEKEVLKTLMPELIDLRRHFHSHPELSGQEYQTAALISGELKKYGWKVKEAVGKTGLIADLGDISGSLVGLRVDMDALPVEEKTGLSFASLNQGVMHACGHDLHTCIGLGVARMLAQNSNQINGVRILFQPAEEIASGARWMKADGALNGVDALFGVHVYPDLPVGKIGVKSGVLTAAAGELEIEIIGEGGHGARPHQAIDPIWIGARVITGIQEAISRCLDPLSPVVISFGKIQGGQAFNVIADRVMLLGTVRCLDPQLNETLPDWIANTVQGIASNLGAEAKVHYRAIAPPVYNDPYLSSLLEKSAISLLESSNVVRLEQPSLGAEDFAEFLKDVPGTMFRLGVSGLEGCAPLHSGYFSPDESALEIGICLLARTLLSWMNETQ
ncbi:MULTISPECIES: amidohydrolase [Prochlorococcus]|uniref:amidohydrolase n=1 Tax=Prochlorococcus TaxID=1218 RepID=UPI0005337ADF|nr:MULTISPECIES: amidohydrolase [Prochlorococcus]KGG13642.1 N-acetyl-L,L-diaminopimelate deacetylase-like [Prochlorococcus sp. MIT 0601]